MSAAPKTGRLVWLTGGSEGIGRAVALGLARRGDRVMVSARSADKLQALVAEAPEGSIIAYPLDITDRAAVAETVARIEAEQGPIDLALLNAGSHKPVSAESFTVDDVRLLVDLNIMGTVNCMEPVIRAFRQRGRGHMAIVASVAGYGGLPTSAAYGATKAALINMAESLKLDFDGLGLKLQLVNPGFVRTPLTDRNDFSMPFLMEPEDAAKALIAGLDEDGFEITFPKRFTYMLKFMQLLPYALYFPMIRWTTKK
ncbi:MAG: SDR family NAD(P)-dependent oxidoreductase [Alphaproteobacteria bacterium]|nr:SDR family NAD(P)-dependent oxidoreductase [Alphaproteobacteria bacterium]MBU0797877.1 SDR family NAD(P)-dependent oxidoreductase [Alphaproteobacteria bacterium]MBU0886171.1 SDR family NAD(P)-dependent oxidoreductase [Alphaproteobacteria bacterium]MBU1812811.1 SDR family NAD(P)-dependent oxidoreductase [Alphaproteobacteria bacterium]MBU2091184.1 SDR family NAD(P)-dependent oxidoreductase [Alphaproteobacteria bacterium]